MPTYNEIRKDRNQLLRMWNECQNEIRELKQRIRELEDATPPGKGEGSE